MINRIKRVWDRISTLGISNDNPDFDVKYYILSNQINFLLFVSLSFMAVFMAVYREIYSVPFNLGDVRINMLIMISIVNLTLSYFGKIKASKLSLLFVVPFFLLIMPTLRGFVEEESFFYYPLLVLVISSLTQLLVNYKKESALFFFSLIYFLILIFVIDILLLKFCPPELNAIKTIYQNNIIITKAVYIVVYFFLQFSIYYLKHINILSEERLLEFNEKLKENNKVLDLQNEELKALKENLKNTQQQLILSEKMASLGQLTAGIAHEINTPLNFISGGSFIINDFMEEIKSGKPLDEESILNATQGSDMITKGIDQASSIVSAFMTFSYSGKSHRRPTDLNKIIDSTLLFQKQRIPQWLTIKKDYKLDRSVDLYTEKMHQVILNLIDNALFEITNSPLPDDEKFLRIKTDYNDTDKIVFLSISNSGRTISPEVGLKLFDPFFTTKEPGKGTGLGLSIVNNLIKEHDGVVSYRNLQNGVVFEITIPV